MTISKLHSLAEGLQFTALVIFIIALAVFPRDGLRAFNLIIAAWMLFLIAWVLKRIR